MKTIKITLALLAIVAVAALYSTGAFIPETNGMADTVAGLIVLNDTEMAQNVGGPWTSEIDEWGNGEYASCHIDNCPDHTFEYTHDRYSCVPCDEDHESKYNSITVVKVTTSWCDDFFVEGIRCDYESAATDWWSSCDNYQGACGDHDWGGEYPYY